MWTLNASAWDTDDQSVISLSTTDWLQVFWVFFVIVMTGVLVLSIFFKKTPRR